MVGFSEIVQAIDGLAKAIAQPYSAYYDNNGWLVERMGQKTRYSKLINSASYSVIAGDNDYSMTTNLPVGIVAAQMPSADQHYCSLYRVWTTVNWNFLVRAWQVATPTTTYNISFHVYVDSNRSITVGFWVSFVI